MSTKSHTISERRQSLRDRLFTRAWQDGSVVYTPRPGLEKVITESWKEHGVCPQCFHWSISDGRCCCGWKSEDYVKRVAAFAALKQKRAQEIADALADYEEYIAKLDAKNRQKGSK